MPGLAELPRYFPRDRAEPCYALYATAIDRFVLVDRHDLSILVRAAMLFSSKLVTVVCVYDSKANPVLSNETCLDWAPVHRVSQANSRVPTVLMLEGAGAIVEKGPVPSVGAEMLERAQRYLLFSLQVLYAQFMANAKSGHADIRMFRGLMPELETLPGAPLASQPQLFAADVRDQKIEDILYYADSLEQARSEIDTLLANREEPKLPGSPVSYQTVFNEFLYGQATVPA
ncbi:MAG TPA: hypothetical protein VGJ74_06080 [Burkholderiales bacterium]|jgi:hypothetical protein